MASATLPLSTTLTRFKTTTTSHSLLHQSYPFPPFSSPTLHLRRTAPPTTASTTYAYVSGPASDPIVSQADPKVDGSVPQAGAVEPPRSVISWGLVWSLVARHKLRLTFSILTLVGCTTCTLSMPIFSGRFFEVLIGSRPEPLWKLLSTVGVLYTLEPIFTVIFVINMSSIWEKVMSTLRALIFRRVLIQKVEFFDRYKVGEITALLTSDLGSVKDVVSENISRDRGFRALSEVIGTICILFVLSPPLAPILGLLMLCVSVLVGKHLFLQN